MRLPVLAGLYVAVVLSAQVGANKIIVLPFTHLEAPGGVYAIGVALALVQLAHYTGVSRRDGAINAQLLIALGFVGSALSSCKDRRYGRGMSVGSTELIKEQRRRHVRRRSGND